MRCSMSEVCSQMWPQGLRCLLVQVPIMLRSEYCNLSNVPDEEGLAKLGECPKDEVCCHALCCTTCLHCLPAYLAGCGRQYHRSWTACLLCPGPMLGAFLVPLHQVQILA